MVLRKLTLALLGTGVILPGLSHALAIRDIQTKSALGQALRVEIELSELGDLSNDDIHVGLATPEDFSRLGIERSFFLSDLRFEVDVKPGGRSVIRVISSKRVTEPYLDFVVRISWPGNTRLQELPILLDPPGSSGAMTQSVAAPVAQVVPTPTPAPAVPSQPAAAVAVSGPVYVPGVFSRAAPPPMDAPEDAPVAASYTVRQSDTLWKIARRVRPDNSVTVPQMMQALYKGNPQAFVDNNINRLRQGEVLRVPGKGDAVATSATTAARQMLAAAKNNGAPATRPVINATAAAKTPATGVAPRPEMKLLAPTDGKTAMAGRANRQSHETEDAATSSRRSYAAGSAPAVPAAAATSRHQQLLKEVSALDTKVKANDRLIAVQNARLAELEARLKARMLADRQERHHKGAEHLHEKKVLATLSCAVAAQAFISADAKAADAPAQAPAGGGSMAPVIGGGVLVAVVAAIFFLRGKGKKDAPPPARPVEPPKAAPAPKAAPEPVVPPKAPEPRKPTDPIDEARAYLNLERYPQAVGVLSKALAQAPDRTDMHMMLLEIFAKQQDRQSFDEQYQKLEALGELEALMKADELKALLPAPVKAPAAKGESIEFERPVIKAADEAGPSLEDLEKDFALSLSQPNLKALDIEIKESPSLVAEEPKELDVGGLDFSFSKEEPVAPAVSAPEPALSFSFEEPVFEAAPPAKAAEEPLSLDSLDAFLAEHAAPAAAPAPAPEPVPAASAPGFDFEQALADFKEETAPIPEPAPAPMPVAAAPAADSGAIRLDEGLDLEEFNVSQINLPVTDVPLHNATETGIEALEGDFNFDDLSSHAAAPAPVAEAKSADPGDSRDLGSAAAAFDAGLAGHAADVALEDEAAFDIPASGNDVLSALDKEFPFLAATDENATRLELARAYADMGDRVAARDLLEEVVAEGNDNQKTEAQGMLMRIG